MLQQRALELINAEIDGELDADERAELDALLEASEAARLLRAELRKLANLLDTLPEEAPPADLASRILEHIRLPGREPATWRARWFARIQPATAGLAFAAGLLLAVGLYEFAPGDRVTLDPSNMVGTMVVNPRNLGVSEKDRLVISGRGISGMVSLGTSGTFRILSFDLDAVGQTEIEIALADAGLGFGGIARAPARGDASADHSFEVSEGILRVTNRGRQSFSVFLLNVAADVDGREISIGISTDGAPAFSGVLRG